MSRHSFTNTSVAIVRSGVFYAAAIAFLWLAATMLGPFLLWPVTIWFDAPGETGGHLIHDVAFAAMLLVAVLGVASQLYRPARRFAGAVGSLVSVLAVVVALAISPEFVDPFVPLLVLIGVVAALHPAGPVRSIRAATVDRRVLALVGLAVVPTVVYAVAQLDLQFGAVDEHAEFGHYAGMAAYAAVVLAFGLLGATTVAGSRFALWAAALLAAYLGLVSLGFATEVSAATGLWAGLAFLWGVATVAVGEAGRRRRRIRRPRAAPIVPDAT